MNNRIMGRPRFAGEALQSEDALNNPQMGMIKDRSSIQGNQEPGGNFVSTRTEKFFDRPE